MMKCGFIGWRGMVGSVLLARMREEGDFDHIEPIFASTSEAGSAGPEIRGVRQPLKDACDVSFLKSLDAIVTCQGSEYTKKIYPELRASGWSGYWIDAASAKRLDDDSVIVLDPVNRDLIDRALAAGAKNFIGGNCTVSLMLMAIYGLYRADLVEWVSTMTYQSASGAGAKCMRELVGQMKVLGAAENTSDDEVTDAILELESRVSQAMRAQSFPTRQFGAPLAGSLLPWIDSEMPNGQTREEWKGTPETRKILGPEGQNAKVDGICVRVGAMRCHSQALTIKLRRAASLADIQSLLQKGNDWVRVIPNTREDTLKYLTPAAVSGTLDVPIGRLRKLEIGPDYLAAFTVGDQLLWGAAEPVRRMLAILIEFLAQKK